jgi:rhamnose utilization protein RhaD (predicted bifunctional aldolase and dehydrogenase)
MAMNQLAALRALSAELGRDVRRTQGAGGNTSLKQDGAMWIKASGTWLADAESRDIMVPVALEPLLGAFRNGDPRAEKATDFVWNAENPSGLRPSIETCVHAAIGHSVVLHIHCVETIALAARTDGEAEIARRLDGLNDVHWAFVPYRRPGVPLGKAIVQAQTPATNVHILGSHGLVVSGASVADAAVRLERVIAALTQPATFPVPKRRAELTASGPYRIAEDPLVHSLAADPWRVAVAADGPMYPDHVIFLGAETGVLEADSSLDALSGTPKLVVVPDRGVLLHENVDRNGTLMARCLAEVAARLPEGAPVRRLDAAEIHALTHWEAEQYRQTLNAGGRDAG